MRLSRQLWVVLHRWAGLAIAAFLVVLGVTGAILAFTDELEPLLVPSVFRSAPPARGAVMLDPFDLRERILGRYPDAIITDVPLQLERGRSVRFNMQRLDPATGDAVPYASDWDEIFVDPYDGSVKGERLWGDVGQGMVNAVPFVHDLHDSLTLGSWGRLTLGIAALIWTLDCFVGFYLTLPMRRNMAGLNRKGWTSRWQQAWRVRWSAGGYKRTFDLHRAGGLWLWPMLLVFAWSGVALSLPQAYDPMMRALGYQPLAEGIAPPSTGRGGPGLDMRAASRRGEALALRAVQDEGLVIKADGPASILYYPKFRVYLYRFTSGASVASASYGDSLVIFSALTGEKLKTVLPQRENAGMALHFWLEALHLASVGGLPYKVLVASLGLLVTSLSITGTLIWSRKRGSQLLGKRRKVCH